MIATEIKFRFGGALSLFSDFLRKSDPKPPFSETFKLFLSRYFETFSQNLLPSVPAAGKLLCVFLLGYLVLKLSKEKNLRLRLGLKLLLIYLLSPIFMLILGFHAAPWILIGLSPAIILAAAYALSKLKLELAILVLLVFFISNVTIVKRATGLGQPLLAPDASAIVSTQLAAIDYTYQKADGKPFAISTVTNPLYINAVWAWNYNWYGKKKYGYLPGWLGGDQEHPYNILPEHRASKDNGKLFFLLTDTSPRIPEIHKILAENWAEEHGKLVEEKDFGAIKVSMWKKVTPF